MISLLFTVSHHIPLEKKETVRKLSKLEKFGSVYHFLQTERQWNYINNMVFIFKKSESITQNHMLWNSVIHFE